MNRIAEGEKIELKKSLLLVQDTLSETKDMFFSLLLNVFSDSKPHPSSKLGQNNYTPKGYCDGTGNVFYKPSESINLIIENIKIVNNELMMSIDNYVDK
ncbi:MAG: hypothetical protein LBV08_01545 [Clostridiales bacterium]|nr:hypothetical protein [Clostridiales bacterium]